MSINVWIVIIIAYEKKAKVLDSGTLSEERVGRFKEVIENYVLALNDACKMIQPHKPASAY